MAESENLKLKDRSAEEQRKDAQSGGVRAGTGTPWRVIFIREASMPRP